LWLLLLLLLVVVVVGLLLLLFVIPPLTSHPTSDNGHCHGHDGQNTIGRQ
jgi:competence protein ComGC